MYQFGQQGDVNTMEEIKLRDYAADSMIPETTTERFYEVDQEWNMR